MKDGRTSLTIEMVTRNGRHFVSSVRFAVHAREREREKKRWPATHPGSAQWVTIICRCRTSPVWMLIDLRQVSRNVRAYKPAGADSCAMRPKIIQRRPKNTSAVKLTCIMDAVLRKAERRFAFSFIPVMQSIRDYLHFTFSDEWNYVNVARTLC